MNTSFFDLKARDIGGREFSFDSLRGKPVLIVNTASKCGFTPQYRGLEALYRKYKDAGLSILGFPCDQFAHQEPGEESEIAAFCERNFGVSFPLMAKIEVNGPNTHPVFAWLKKKSAGLLGAQIRWNFTKFLVSGDGERVQRFAPATEPEAMEGRIRQALGIPD